MSLYAAAVPQFRKMLVNLASWLREAGEYATAKGFDADTLVTDRLAPDQFNLGRQVQCACDTAKFMASRLTGQDAPSHPDTETTLAELITRVETVVAYLDAVGPEQFQGAASRPIHLPFLPDGVWVKGTHYFNEFANPNFYFHITTAYAILRHRGVPLGKRGYIGAMTLQKGPAGA